MDGIDGRSKFPIEATVKSKHVSFCGDCSYFEKAFCTTICSDSIVPTFISGPRDRFFGGSIINLVMELSST